MSPIYIKTLVALAATLALSATYCNTQLHTEFHASTNFGHGAGVHFDFNLNTHEHHLVSMTLPTIQNTLRMNPYMYHPVDVNLLMAGQHPTLSLGRFIRQRSYDLSRAAGLVIETLGWRARMKLPEMSAANFPCDLFKMGLIFEYGVARNVIPDGKHVEGSPIIWLRLRALGKIIKYLERLTPTRVTSAIANTPRSAWYKVRKAFSLAPRSVYRHSARQSSSPIVRDLSVRNDDSVMHVLSAIAWWLDEWTRQNPGKKATLIMDFENSDYAFASWTVGDFLVKLDDHFPDLFDQIVGFRYAAKLWSLHSPISMFTRIFKKTVQSAPETDMKLKFIKPDTQIYNILPIHHEHGHVMLPPHLAEPCVPRDYPAPAGCNPSHEMRNGLYDQHFWHAMHQESYQACHTNKDL